MENVFDFLRAVLPWIAIGLLLAVFFARKGKKKRGKTQEDDYTVATAMPCWRSTPPAICRVPTTNAASGC